ncbi:MAG: hypothetical protein A2Y07_09750 [Planctomycetes bacterium GWF2_50_10]|nr:MAG: hypothetical protein A2Y07_09750 [Planctomycetes bacterium GWF2_50_10]
MPGKIIAIAKNTFLEILRQPIYTVIIVAALLMLMLSPSITMYTMSDDNKLLRELALSTLFLSGLFIAIFSASGAITEEIESKTITTVLTKPIARPTFIVGKFLGITAAVALAHYILTIAMLFAVRHGVLESASDEPDMVVITAAAIVVGATMLFTFFVNYFYDWNFPATAITVGSILATAAFGMLFFINKEWHFDPANNGFKIFDVYASILLLLAVIVMISLAVAFSTRFNIVITLTACICVFMLGLISDYIFGRFAAHSYLANIAWTVLPNLQTFWISDAIYEGSAIPLKYITLAAGYCGAYTAAILAAAIAIFQRRQVG